MSYRTPSQILSFLEKNRHRLDNPTQSMGDEPNSYGKPWNEAVTRTCLFACWDATQAAGNQAIPMVYQAINEWPGYDGLKRHMCDRSYWYATPHDMRVAEQAGIPVFGVESKHQLADFDVIGTSISYQVLSINFIKQLLLSDIPVTWADRTTLAGAPVAGRHRDPGAWPMVICGGQSYGAPEVVANIVDAWVLGEAEDEEDNPGIGAVLDRIGVMKASGRWQADRLSCYVSLAREFNFLYFPFLVDTHYAYEDRPSVAEAAAALPRYPIDMPVLQVVPSKQVHGITGRVPGVRMVSVKRFVKNLDSLRGLDNPPLLYSGLQMGSGDVEVSRSCPAFCTFCALSWRSKPYRQRSVEWTTEFSKRLLRNTGGTHLSPFGPDFPLHTQRMGVITSLLENVCDDVDNSSVRIDDAIDDPRYLLLMAKGGMDSLTIGVEGNGQRMRDLVGKGAADADIREAAAKGIRAGIRKFKLYMIAALPGEDAGDIAKIMEIARDLADIRDSMGSNARIMFAWTPMLIEANTPMQWFATTNINYALGDMWEELKTLRIDFKLGGGKAQKDKQAYFQVSQRASREIGMALVEAVCEMNKGSWGGVPHGLLDMMLVFLARHGFLNGLADCYDERTKADLFGHEMVSQGISGDILWTTYQKMKTFLETTDSATYDSTLPQDYHGVEHVEKCSNRCSGNSCGVCSPDDLRIRKAYIAAAADESKVDLADVKIIDEKTIAMRVRCRFETSVAKRQVETVFWRFALRRAAFRADVPITKRTLTFASETLRYRDWTCGADYVEFGLTRRVPPAEVAKMVQAMNAELGPDIQITGHVLRPAVATPLTHEMDLSLYDLELGVTADAAQAAIDRWEAAEYVPLVITEENNASGPVRGEVNGRDLVGRIWLVKDGHRLRARMTIRGKANPYLTHAAMFGSNSWLEAARYPAIRLETFASQDDTQISSFNVICESCLAQVPNTLLETAYHDRFCPQCLDRHEGRILEVAHT